MPRASLFGTWVLGYKWIAILTNVRKPVFKLSRSLLELADNVPDSVHHTNQ
jgi:hypothetical protein